jgi:hypothetical protein
MLFDEYLIRDILANNKFGIGQVSELKFISSLFFKKEEYSKYLCLLIIYKPTGKAHIPQDLLLRAG